MSFVASASSQVTTDPINAPQSDTTTINDSSTIVTRDTMAREARPPVSDSVSKRPPAIATWEPEAGSPIFSQVLKHHPFFPFNVAPLVENFHKVPKDGKEILFYNLVAIALIFAFLKIAFAKYFNDLFRVFFRTTMKQRQIREQLMQTPLPSLMYNLFFIATTALYLDFLLFYYDIKPVSSFWMLYLYCAMGLGIIYLVKFIGLKICGWLFNMKNAADSYIFIVFIINKMIGILLLPFLALLAFTDGIIHAVSLVLSWAGIGALLLYRFILGYSAVRNEVRFNLFHFFLYLVAFEITPLLLIYKLLLVFFK